MFDHNQQHHCICTYRPVATCAIHWNLNLKSCKRQITNNHAKDWQVFQDKAILVKTNKAAMYVHAGAQQACAAAKETCLCALLLAHCCLLNLLMVSN